jgi:F-box and WD-40 domain protein 1/11
MSTPTLGENAEEPPAKIPHSAHSKLRVFRGFGSIRGHRRPATSGPSGDFARYNPSPAPIPSHYPAPAPGQAARAAAAAANNERLSKLRQEEMTSAYLDGTLQSERSADDVLKDSESGVGMSCTSPVLEVLEEPETKFDPVQHLPAEITTMILANLDAPSLIRAECVSRQWREAASSPHVWKFAFLRRFEPEIHVSPTPIMMGGAGIGKFKNGKPAPAQDWKKMYQVRMTINRRWRGCSPSAIYLNGHTDSVYCCQFDE